MDENKIIIIGSCNIDMVMTVKQLPKPGETILGDSFRMYSGGKGANQAVAATRMGGAITFIAKVGNDLFGKQVLENYKTEGMDVSHIVMDNQLPTGVALINVSEDGENSITVSSGANAALDSAHVESAREVIEGASILLMQLETPLETVEFASKLANEKGVKVVLNPAPATPLPDKLLRNLYAIIPNKTEAEMLSGVRILDWNSAKEAANAISAKGVEIVVITLGEKGALVKDGIKYYDVPGYKVDAVDTTAAGDTFCGAFCVAISEGKSIKDAVMVANRAASIAVTRFGAQDSIPHRDEVYKLMEKH